MPNKSSKSPSIQLFASKSDTLKYLQSKIQKSKIEPIFDFSVSDWLQNEKYLLDKISIKFKTGKVVVRSSALGEDSITSSKAGEYESILNVNPRSKHQLKKAIIRVQNSYVNKNSNNLQNKILIQKQSQGIILNGVIFTRSPDVGKPYFVINFQEGSNTDWVTSGKKVETIKIFRKTNPSEIPQKWISLVTAIKEIEKIVYNDHLDIEFGITKKNTIIIFQVRPIINLTSNLEYNLEKKIEKLVSSCKKNYQIFENNKTSQGDLVIFSDMTDWNPSEIIGENPNLLAYSLYSYLIMNDSWSKGRSKIGYQKISNTKLIKKFGNKPYVDVSASFNSLIPDALNGNLKKKLVNFYLQKLYDNPFLHDKTEFEILFTCYDLSIDSRLKELESNGFTKNEIKIIHDVLVDLTNNIIYRFPNILTDANHSIKKLASNKKKILQKSATVKVNHVNQIKIAKSLLNDCKKYGTVSFSIIARIAFIATAILKNMVTKGYVNQKFVDDFMTTFSTPVSEMQNDFMDVYNHKMTKKQFLKKYGHLRPGTYDITKLRYDKDYSFLNNINFPKNKKNVKTKLKTRIDLDSIISNSELNFVNYDLLNFVKDAITLRERLKFEFTKNLSEAIECIVEAGSYLGFSRDDLSHLDISTILKSAIIKKKSTIQLLWKNKISKNKRTHKLQEHLILPPLIFDEIDFELVKYYFSKPNYISNKKIIGTLSNLDKYSSTSQDIENKIVLIENADPGYDWIFTKNPSALVTKYGGVASHMAIRCAELGLPGAIGCGDMLFEKIKTASRIMLDCKNNQIIILDYHNEDEFIEEKMILKSLGYIV